TRHLRFDIGLLADRLIGAMRWLDTENDTRGLPVGLFGASTGGGAALVAAAHRPDRVDAVVSRGGRPDLAGDDLPFGSAPTSSLVSLKSAYQIPTARNGSGVTAQMISSTSFRIASQVSTGAMGTATTILRAPSARNASTAARIVDPVANPSSIRITV